MNCRHQMYLYGRYISIFGCQAISFWGLFRPNVCINCLGAVRDIYSLGEYFTVHSCFEVSLPVSAFAHIFFFHIY